ncbi:MAG TPA: sulfite exporter TauE/SafE family protein [Halanaerobiales bacterium]|nr:sulfite exporter TauE/SafE family protein [Halanaerobiales bacterium]
MNTYILSAIILLIAVSMAMVGKGGGNFYILAMITAGISMHYAATTSQLIMMTTAGISMIIFNKNKRVDWKLALVVDPATDIMAFVGGYVAGGFEGYILKLMFAVSLILVTIFMFVPVKNKDISKVNRLGFWKRNFGEHNYVVNLWLTIPIAGIVGFVAGAIGISGGSFKIPLMVLAGGVPIEVAVGTSSAMVAVTALMGFIGHGLQGNINLPLAIPFVIAAVTGGLIGSKWAIKTKPENLKLIFAVINIAAAIFMIINISL